MNAFDIERGQEKSLYETRHGDQLDILTISGVLRNPPL